jgi:S-adenosylmethionine hydrolase
MAIITLLTDYGYSDHYVAAVKAKILMINPAARIIDISHKIEHFNLAHAAFVLKSVFRDFPEGTIHAVMINSPSRYKDKYVALRLENHIFTGADSGIFSLISSEPPQEIVEIPAGESSAGIFPGKDIIAPVAAFLSTGKELSDAGNPVAGIRSMLNRQLRVSKNQLIGNVVHIDHYGNLITNISKKEFSDAGRGRPFTVSFSRESIQELSVNYSGQESGECIALFNSSDLLEIAIIHGNASQLLGMHFDSPVLISFSGE